MATLTIRNVPEAVCLELKSQAERNRRSLNQEVVHTLENVCAFTVEQRKFDEAMARIDGIRQGITYFPSSEEIDRAMDEGRR
jgi:plasmid stability protein